MAVNTGIVVPPGGGGGGGGSGTPPSLLIGNVVVVSKSGNDTTGARQDWKYHYLTYDAAFAAAQSGDTIVVMPGSFTATTLLKDGVRLYAFPGAEISISASINIGSLSDSGVFGHADFIDLAGGLTLELAAAQTIVWECNSMSVSSWSIGGASTDSVYTIDIKEDITILGTSGLYIDNPKIAFLNMNVRDIIQESGDTSTGLQVWGNHATGNQIVIKGRNIISRDVGFLCIRYGDSTSDNKTNCLVEFDLYESQGDWTTLTNVIVGVVDVCQETAGDDYESQWQTVIGHANSVFKCVGTSSCVIVAASQLVRINGHISTEDDSQALYLSNSSATRTLPTSVKQYININCSINQNDVSSNPAIQCIGANEVYITMNEAIYQRRLIDMSGGNIRLVLSGNAMRHQSAATNSNPIVISGDYEVLFLQDFNLNAGTATSGIDCQGDGIVVHTKNVKITNAGTNCISTTGTVDVVLLSLYANVTTGAGVTNIVGATTIIVDSDIT